MTIKTQRLLARAKKIAKKGEHEEARKLYTTILEASPDDKEAKNGLLLTLPLQTEETFTIIQAL